VIRTVGQSGWPTLRMSRVCGQPQRERWGYPIANARDAGRRSIRRGVDLRVEPFFLLAARPTPWVANQADRADRARGRHHQRSGATGPRARRLIRNVTRLKLERTQAII